MTAYTCPKGHASGTDDFCDTCGAKIGGTMPITPPVTSMSASQPSASQASTSSVSAPPASTGAEICPNCGTPRTGTWRFCEDCGFDHTTGKVPVLDVPPTGPVTPVQRPVGRWTATVG